MMKPNVDWDFKRHIVDITCREWGNVQDQFVTMSFDEYEDWLTEQLCIVLAKKRDDVKE